MAAASSVNFHMAVLIPKSLASRLKLPNLKRAVQTETAKLEASLSLQFAVSGLQGVESTQCILAEVKNIASVVASRASGNRQVVTCVRSPKPRGWVVVKELEVN